MAFVICEIYLRTTRGQSVFFLGAYFDAGCQFMCTVALKSSDERSIRSLVGQRVHMPSAEGKITPEIAESKLDLPELVSPITAI